MSVASDVELLMGWRRGDRDAADALFERYFEPLLRFFRSKLGDDLPTLEDLIQQTWLACTERRDQVQPERFRAYLFAVARNRLFDHLRAQHRRPQLNLENTSIAALQTTPSQKVASAQTHALVIAALQQLPLDFQITLELKYWEHMSDAEIAQVLAVAPNTIRSRLSRGRGMLKEALLRATSQKSAQASLSQFFGDR